MRVMSLSQGYEKEKKREECRRWDSTLSYTQWQEQRGQPSHGMSQYSSDHSADANHDENYHD